MCELTVLYKDGHQAVFVVQRVSNISTNAELCTPRLYYKKPGQLHGSGSMILLEDVDCWEVNMV